MIERLVSPQVAAAESFGDISDCKIPSQIYVFVALWKRWRTRSR
jgi:hypothetical protein